MGRTSLAFLLFARGHTLVTFPLRRRRAEQYISQRRASRNSKKTGGSSFYNMEITHQSGLFSAACNGASSEELWRTRTPIDSFTTDVLPHRFIIVEVSSWRPFGLFSRQDCINTRDQVEVKALWRLHKKKQSRI